MDKIPNNNILPWTGERMVPEINDPTTKVEHLHRYAYAMEIAKGKNVLDIASGEGYGSNLISKVAKNVTGVDIDRLTVDYAKNKYKKDNLKFIHGAADNIPVNTGSMDIVISFETIEHHNKHDEMLIEIKRVLKPEGVLIISTPEKLTYSDNALYKNPHHVKELYLEEFRGLVNKYFNYSKMFFQKSMYCNVLFPETNNPSSLVECNGDWNNINTHPNIQKQMYNICIASNHPIQQDYISIFNIFDMNEKMEKIKKEIYHSKTYRLGHLISFPFKIIVSLMGVKKYK